MARLSPQALGAVLGVLVLLVALPALADVTPEIRTALLRRDYPTAVALLEPMARNSNADALFELGRLYERGLGAARDLGRAFDCFRRAGELGHVDAAYLTGVMLEKGRGTAVDAEGARQWYQRAAAAGQPLARRKLDPDSEAAGTAARSLYQIVEAGDPAALAMLGPVDFDALDAHGRLPLGMAVAAADAPMVDALLQRHANPNARDAGGRRPLHGAAALGSVGLARRLVAAGADPAAPDAAGDTPLHLAVAGGHVALARWLLGHGAATGAVNAAGWSAAMLAERSGNPELQGLFGSAEKASGGTLTQLDDMRRSPAMADWSELAIASWAGRTSLVRKLLDGGADPNVLDRSHHSALFRAIDAGHADVAALLLSHGARPNLDAADDVSLVHRLARSGPSSLLTSVLRYPGELERRDASGRTPLMAAVGRDNVETAEVLLASGASPQVADKRGDTPLHLAAERGDAALAERLLAAGAVVDARDRSGRTPLWRAARHGQLATVEVLLAHHAGLEAAADGISPLHVAAELPQSDVLELLLARSPAADVVSTTGTTPLLLAADRGRAGSVQALLAAGAKVDARNAVGDTPLICAVRHGHLDVSRLLLAAGANYRQRNERRESARELAAARHDPELDALFASRGGVLDLLR